MRLVLDANVLIPGLVVPGVCKDLMRHCLIRHTVVSSEYILHEVATKLVKKLRLSAASSRAMLDTLRERLVLVEPAAIEPLACRDPKDLPVLGTAVAGQTRCLITGDADLLVLSSYRGIVMLRPASFWPFEQTDAGR